MAFSGGRIRSAAFGLGVLLVLIRLRLFNCVDYLSTVIGGYSVLDGNSRLFWLFITITVSVFYSLMFININMTSLHNFYRDVLSRAYLVRSADEVPGRLEHNDTQKLSGLDAAHGPYHLINCAVNLSDRQGVYNEDRRADFFLFSK